MNTVAADARILLSRAVPAVARLSCLDVKTGLTGQLIPECWWPDHRTFGGCALVAHFVSADWSKNRGKRAVYLANVGERRIAKGRRSGPGWDFNAMLGLEEDLSRDGPVLIGVDVVLGVSEGYCQMIREKGWQPAPKTFVEWLGGGGISEGFLETVDDPIDWSLNRVWFRV